MSASIVYKLYDANQSLLYVGVTICGVKRLNEHLREKAWFEQVEEVRFERFVESDDAYAREKTLILTQSSRYNVVHNPHHPDTYVPDALRIPRPRVNGETGQIEGDEEVLTLAQAAKRIGLSPNTLRNQIKNGALAGRLMGTTYLITASELKRYDVQRKQPRGFARPDHPMHGKGGPGGRPKKDA